ncbi:MAG: hypothetical protein AB7E55_18405 [Pigmentiphaga sp.]
MKHIAFIALMLSALTFAAYAQPPDTKAAAPSMCERRGEAQHGDLEPVLPA